MSSSSLFMTPRDDTQGILDIGKHCFECQRLDFLPFACEFCNHVYCSDHRSLDLHNCTGNRPQKQRALDGLDSKEKVASLFPDRKENMKKVDQSLAAAPKPTTIMQKQFKVGDAAKFTNNAFQKFANFLKKTNSSSESSKLKSKAADMVLLRKTAKGDVKIQASDKIYVWIKNIETSKRDAMFISKNWPTGRALDVIAEQLRLKNNNNLTTIDSERLNMFLSSKSGEPVLIRPNERCSRFANGDEIFLVRGSV